MNRAFRYARALYETAEEHSSLPSVSEDMDIVQKIIDEVPGIKRYCLDSRPGRTSEMDFIRTAFLPYVGDYTGNMLKILVRSGRIAALPLIPKAFRALKDRYTGVTRILIETAGEQDPEIENLIQKKMEHRTGNSITIEGRINPDLIGGIRISWDNKIIDMSVQGRMRKLRTLLKSH